MTPKEFSQSLYDANDDAKHQVIAWLETRGFMAWVNDDNMASMFRRCVWVSSMCLRWK